MRDSEQGRGQVPDIVSPPAPPVPPSAMKGAGGHPPRSPKDKVTFAEFTEIAEDGREDQSDIVKTELIANLDVPIEFNGKVIILESSQDKKYSDKRREEETEGLLTQSSPD